MTNCYKRNYAIMMIVALPNILLHAIILFMGLIVNLLLLVIVLSVRWLLRLLELNWGVFSIPWKVYTAIQTAFSLNKYLTNPSRVYLQEILKKAKTRRIQ